MNVTVLHLSDLHRDPKLGLSNAALLRSLSADCQRYAHSPGIRPPDIAVVSGDLVYGVPPDFPNADAELERQYGEAEGFLAALTEEFFRGNRERVVLVPGNHDISFPIVQKCLTRVEIDHSHPDRARIISEHVSKIFAAGSDIRWCWRTLAFYKIGDRDAYDSRLSGFVSMHDRFYRGTRRYSANPDRQYGVFDYPDERLTFVAFNSCFNNDPLNRAGRIHPESIAHATREVGDVRYDGRLLCAVWHHNTSGGPLAIDYMDADTLQVMIDSGYSLALHGHQHKPEFIDERFRFGSDRKLTVISAGTLCGGETALPSGVPRSYNLIELDVKKCTGRLHTRYMGNNDFASPVWASAQQSPPIVFGLQRPAERRRPLLSTLANAESLIAAKNFPAAQAILRPLAASNDIARRLLFECYLNLDFDEAFFEIFFPPVSDAEVVVLADVLWRHGLRDKLAALLELEIVRHSTAPLVIETRTMYGARLKVK